MLQITCIGVIWGELCEMQRLTAEGTVRHEVLHVTDGEWPTLWGREE